jgi:LacI family transcriptional regulator
VKAETRAQVRAAMAELGYVYNRAAATLRSATTGLVGLVINDLRNPFFAEFATSLQMALSAQGYAAVVANTDEDTRVQAQVIGAMIEHGVAAIIIAPSYGPGDGGFAAIERAGIPTLQVLRRVDRDGAPFPFAAPDYQEGTRAATEHLVASGARRIAFVGGLPDRPVTLARMQGYRDALGAAGLPEVILTGRSTRRFGRDLAERLVREHPDLDAVMCFNDLVALGLLAGCQKSGLRVGAGGLRIMGFDDLEECADAWPSLSSVSCDIAGFGERIAAIILRWITEGVAPEPEWLSPVSLALRASTEPGPEPAPRPA